VSSFKIGSQIRERVKAKLENKRIEAKIRRSGEKGFREGVGAARQRGRVRGHDGKVQLRGRGDNSEAAVAGRKSGTRAAEKVERYPNGRLGHRCTQLDPCGLPTCWIQNREITVLAI
jgi:hypothetical protein